MRPLIEDNASEGGGKLWECTINGAEGRTRGETGSYASTDFLHELGIYLEVSSPDFQGEYNMNHETIRNL